MNVLLYAPQNPVNLGNIVRTSACFGIDCIYVYDRNLLLNNSKSLKEIRRISTGLVNKVRIETVDAPLEFILQHENRFAA